MAHEIEIINGKAQMAYAGEVPWHGLGKKISNDLTPAQILEEAGLDWEVEKIPAYATVGGAHVAVGRSALIRTMDNKILDVVSDDWNPVQNSEAFEFFNDFIAEGGMEMHTAGSLKGGQIVWALAKVNNSFELFGGDVVESYLHFTNFHKYGFSTDVRLTPTRVVCNNTLTLSLSTNVERFAKISHRREFDGDKVKLMLGVASEKLAKYKEMAHFIGNKRFTNDNVIEYFKNLFPLGGNQESKNAKLSKNASLGIKIMDTQPGAKYAEGTWWQPFNAVTYMTDHLMSRNVDNRLTSAWYGGGRSLKIKALELALEFANS